MGSDSERREPPRSKAELKAAMAKLLQEEHERELLDRKKALQDRRSNVGEGTSSITGKMLVPASPSPRKKARDALMNPVRTNTSKGLLASHKRHSDTGRRTSNDQYSLPSFEKHGASSSHPVASGSSSLRRRREAEGEDLASLMEHDAASRLAQKQRLPPSTVLDGNAIARKKLKDADSKRDIATMRSSTFHEPAPKLSHQPTASTSKSASTSTQPIPSYNATYRRYPKENGTTASSYNGATSSIAKDYKGKSVDRERHQDPSLEKKEPFVPATKHNWQSRTSANQDVKQENEIDPHQHHYYSFEDEEELLKATGEYEYNEDEDEDSAYQDIPYKPIGNERNDDLTLVHRIRPGPKHFKAPASDPTFEHVEPNSKIFLSKRLLSHSALQSHLSDRFYLPHETLYSIVRPSKGGLEYEVPVEGDWIVIGVLAEKSEIKYTGGNPNFNRAANGQDAALRQLEMRKRMEEERKKKAKELARERARAQFRDKNNTTEGGGGKTYDDSAFDEIVKSDDELKEAFEGSDGEYNLNVDKTKKKGNKKDKKEEEEEEAKEPPQKRRYITFKLLDLGKKNASSGTGILSLKLFESDPDLRRKIKSAKDDSEEETEVIYNKKTGKKTLVTRSKREKRLANLNKAASGSEKGGTGGKKGSVVEDEEDRFERKEYKGGSGGAFEKFWKELNGTVVAVLNPRIMKPWQNAYAQNPNGNILSLTPESADSVIVIGKSRDLGSCQARKKDGSLCASWCDLRNDTICEYHIAQAVNRRRAGRAELLSGTGGMQTTHVSGDITSLQPQKKSSSTGGGRLFVGGSSHSAPYDPDNKIGLLPRNNTSVQEGSKTYVVPSGTDPGVNGGRGTGGYRTGALGAPRPFSSTGGRPGMSDPSTRSNSQHKPLDPKEAAVKKAREERKLQRLLAKEGGKSVGAKYLHTNGKAPSITTLGGNGNNSSGMDGEDSTNSQSEMDIDNDKTQEKKKRIFTVDSLRKIGFDPTSMPAHADARQQKRKMEAMQVLGDPDACEPKLGKHPGKGHSNVHKPQEVHGEADTTAALGDAEDDDDYDVPRPPKRRPTNTSKQDPGVQSSSSEDEPTRPTVSNAPVDKTVSTVTAPAASDEDSDLEIEPPVPT